MYDNVSGNRCDSGTGVHNYQAATKKGRELDGTSEEVLNGYKHCSCSLELMKQNELPH